ncbi:MAG TPA: hypothetical protein VF454_07075 [Gemmatimonadales bacterium]
MADSQDPSDPLVLLRLAFSFILLFVTAAALFIGLSGIYRPALVMVGGLWTAYGLGRAAISGVLSPGAEWIGQVIANTGLRRSADQHGEIDALAARGQYSDAAERWFREAVEGEAPAHAMLRRAELLAGPLKDAGSAAAELTQYREAPRLPLRPAEDVAIGLALVDIYEHRLADPAKAMFELRRLLDRYPESRHVRRIRAALNDLKERRFGDAFDPDTDP